MPPAYAKAPNPNVERPEYADGCTGKVRFDSPSLAADVAKKRKGYGPGTKGDRRTRESYRCAACGGWHLGTSHGMQSRARV
jgi:hypothetical protein